ncbi:hypothetical protein PHET_08295 [Paragonimus heterotremus]|uniref:Uncharacterized protein n=1 Tax=Paragonimus heterotremus TaxID=100268 RepID=A0A8J4WPJ4_9TREM|nr:hypothetical protein PHET_08295 [Paragonimus heterotremus]
MKEKELSVNDRQAIGLMETSSRLTDGPYEVAHLLRPRSFLSPNNGSIALKRLRMLRQRFMESGDLAQHYSQVMGGPAYMVSRGVYIYESRKLDRWLYGPEFIHSRESYWPSPVGTRPDKKKVSEQVCDAVTVQILDHSHFFISKFEDFTSWDNLLQTVIWSLRHKQFVSKNGQIVCTGKLTASELNKATEEIFRLVQKQLFRPEIKKLHTRRCNKETTNAHPASVKKFLRIGRSPLQRLNLFLLNGILSVG